MTATARYCLTSPGDGRAAACARVTENPVRYVSAISTLRIWPARISSLNLLNSTISPWGCTRKVLTMNIPTSTARKYHMEKRN